MWRICVKNFIRIGPLVLEILSTWLRKTLLDGPFFWKVEPQIRIFRPWKPLSTYFCEREVPLFEVSSSFWNRHIVLEHLNAKFGILSSENPWVRIIAIVKSFHLNSFRHFESVILFLKILTSNSNSSTLETIDYEFSSCINQQFHFWPAFRVFQTTVRCDLSCAMNRPEANFNYSLSVSTILKWMTSLTP